jgi:hypothetical protein
MKTSEAKSAFLGAAIVITILLTPSFIMQRLHNKRRD